MSKTVLPPFAALRAFAAVGHGGGIRRAADLLGVSHAIVSRHVSALEQHFCTPLLNRTTGQLTDAGQIYHARISHAIGEMESATEALLAGRGACLTIWCSPGFALHWLTRRLQGFGLGRGRQRPIIDLRSTDSEPNFDRGEADGDIRYCPDGARPAGRRGIRLLQLARPLVFPVASPRFLAALKQPINDATSLLDLPLIEENDQSEWLAWFLAQGVAPSASNVPVARYGQGHLTIAAARAGQGIALSNPYLVAEDMEAGRLVRVDSAQCSFKPVTLGAYVFRASQARWQDPALIRFRSWLKSALAHEYEPLPS